MGLFYLYLAIIEVSVFSFIFHLRVKIVLTVWIPRLNILLKKCD